MLDHLLRDLRHAVRSLLRTPGVAGVAVLTLALGIGANSAIFSVVRHLLFDPLPFLDERGLVAVWETGPRGNDHNEVSAANFRDWREQASSFERLVAHAWWTTNLTGTEGPPEQIQGFRVSPDYFDALRVRPLLGRMFLPGDDSIRPARVVILGHGLWQHRFGADSGIVGRTLLLNGLPREVIGVLPPGVRYPAPAELWIPLAESPEQWASRRGRYLLVTGRLRQGVELPAARAELAAIARQLGESDPEAMRGWGINIQPLVGDVTRMIGPILRVLFGAVLFVLLIACANVANLLLARGTGRARELAVRAALGASRARIVRGLLAEGVVLAAAGGGIGVLLSLWGVSALTALVPPEHQRFLLGFDRVAVDGAVLAFTAVSARGTVLVFALAPALQVSRGELHGRLQEGTRAGGSARRHGLRGFFVGSQVALALALLAVAGLLVRAFRDLTAVPLGFRTEGVALTSVALPSSRYQAPERVVGFWRDLTARAATLPGVTAAGAVNVTPLCQCNQTAGFAIDGAPPFPVGEGPEVGWRVVTPGYFATLDVPVLRGRGFADTDDDGAPRVVIVNQATARRWFGGEAVGRRIRLGGDSVPREIVGMVADVRHDGPTREAGPELYVPHAQIANTELTLAVRTAGEAGALLPALRAAVLSLDGEQPVFDQRTMADAARLAVGPQRFAMRLLLALGAIALALAAAGIYGVVTHLVGERTHEIGVRMALGGTPRDVLRYVLRAGLRAAAVGLAVGTAGAAAASTALPALLVGTRRLDPVTYLAVGALLAAVAFVAAWAPARRATRVDPMIALRAE